MTHQPDKGALRRGAAERRSRHAQRTPLPPRADGAYDETVMDAYLEAVTRVRRAEERVGIAAKALRDAEEHLAVCRRVAEAMSRAADAEVARAWQAGLMPEAPPPQE